MNSPRVTSYLPVHVHGSTVDHAAHIALARPTMEPPEEEPPAKRAKADAEDAAPAAEDAPATEEAPAKEEGAAVEETPAGAEEAAPLEEGASADAVAPAEEPAAEVAPVALAAETPAAEQGDGISNEELVDLLAKRTEAKRMRDFATSDNIRTSLEARGVHITDAKGQTQLGRWVALDGREGNTQGPDYFQQAPPAFGQGAALVVPQLAYTRPPGTHGFGSERRFTLLTPAPRLRMLRLPTLRCRSQTRATRCRRRRRQATAARTAVRRPRTVARRRRRRRRPSPGRG